MTNRANVATDAATVAGSGRATERFPSLILRLASHLRVEDLLLTGLVLAAGLANPPRNLASPFDTDPVQGWLRLGVVLAALACAAARTAPDGGGSGRDRSPWSEESPTAGGLSPTGESPRAGGGSTVVASGALGPFAGAVLLLAISGGTAAGLPSWGGPAFVALAAAVMVAARFAAPPLPAGARRALMTPFILVAGGLFWGVIDAIFSGPLVSGPVGPATLRALVASPAFGFLAAFSAVYYAMLVYAPRQIAEREGGPVAWVVRYLVFLAGISLGIGWAGALAG